MFAGGIHSDTKLCDLGHVAYCDQIATKARIQSHHAVSTWLEKHGILSADAKVYDRRQRERARSHHQAMARLRAKLCASGDVGACQEITDASIALDSTNRMSYTDTAPSRDEVHEPPISSPLTDLQEQYRLLR